MGQQQLLLIILGVIVVGIAVAVGITMFNDSAVSANRDAVTNDLVNLASRAQQFYRRPIALGGGGGSFTNLNSMALLTKTSGSSMVNGNGTYTLTTGTSSITLTGHGTETGNDGTTPVSVTMLVWADSARVDATQTN
jgi:Tfp pilus assembly protein PilE